MKKIVLPALVSVAVIGLSACSEPTDNTAVDEAAVEEPAMTPPVAADDMTEAPAAADSMVVDENGMEATITDGGTTTTVDIDKDPSMAIETD